MKLISFIIIFLGFLIYSFFNLGKFLDVTQEPSKTDLIVSLGGNGYLRLQKSISLVEQNFSNTIIITGYDGTKVTKAKNIPDPRLKVINNEKYKNINFIINPNLKNTAEEIIYVKKYMKENNLKDVTFVTEKPHSRRILILVNLLGEKGDFKFAHPSADIMGLVKSIHTSALPIESIDISLKFASLETGSIILHISKHKSRQSTVPQMLWIKR